MIVTTAGGNQVKTVLGMTPTIVLRRLDPTAIINKFQAGHYNTLRRTDLSHVEISLPQATTSSVYTYRDNNGNPQNVYVTSHDLTEMPSDFHCRSCHKHFKFEGGQTAIGIPVAMNRHSDGLIEYVVDGPICGFRCALRATKRKTGGYSRFRDPVYVDSEVLLRQWFYSLHPEKALIEAPEYSIGYDDYIFFSSPTYTVTPVKRSVLLMRG